MNALAYKGFVATVGFDAEDMILVGRLSGVNDVVGFHAETASDLLEAFHEAVDDYVEACARAGKAPQKPYSGKMMLRVDPIVHAQAALAAELAGKSLNAWGEEALRSASEQSIGEARAA